MLCGADPGRSGAIAWLTDAGELIHIEDMPTEEIKVGSGRRHVVAPARLAECLRVRRPVQFFLERVSARPGEGAVGAFTFGRGYGCIEGVIAALGVSIRYVPPQVWKKALGVPSDKGGARLRAQQMFPAHAQMFGRVKDHGRAESALIGLWGVQAMRVGRAA